jgi:hypothetical protein
MPCHSSESKLLRLARFWGVSSKVQIRVPYLIVNKELRGCERGDCFAPLVFGLLYSSPILSQVCDSDSLRGLN